jgi:hypothetical protein
MSPVQAGESVFLAQMMVSGEPQPYPFKFTDPRHRIIYDILSHLQHITYCPGPRELVQYLDEFGYIKKVGGLGYIRALFRGVV